MLSRGTLDQELALISAESSPPAGRPRSGEHGSRGRRADGARICRSVCPPRAFETNRRATRSPSLPDWGRRERGCVTLAPVPDRYGPKTALVVVDVQNDFADPGGSLFVQGAAAILPLLNSEAKLATDAGAFVVYTQDW